MLINWHKKLALTDLDLDSKWLKLSRKQKAHRFRHLRRKLSLKLYGDTHTKRRPVKNPNRQCASKNRRRDADGKFLIGSS